jgi:hypothetical protein
MANALQIIKWLLIAAAGVLLVLWIVPDSDASLVEQLRFGLAAAVGGAIWFGADLWRRLDQAQSQRAAQIEQTKRVADKVDTLISRVSALDKTPPDPYR